MIVTRSDDRRRMLRIPCDRGAVKARWHEVSTGALVSRLGRA
jgi:hypothetical protein